MPEALEDEVVTLADDEVVVAIDDDELEADELVGLAVSDTSPPVTLYCAAHATRSKLSGQHHVWPTVSAVQ